MYEPVENADGLLAGLMALVWALAAVSAHGLALRPSNEALVRRASRLRWLVRLGVLLAVIRVVLFALMWTVDWLFAEPRFLVSVPVLVPALCAVVVLSLPALRRIVRSKGGPAATRAAAADPRLVVPIEAAAVAALIGLYAAYVSRPVRSYVDDLLTHLGPLVLATGLLWWWARQRRRSVAVVTLAYRTPLHRASRAGLATVVGLALVAGLVAVVARSTRLPERVSMANHDNVDWGGGAVGAHHAAIGVETLTGPRTGEPDHRFTLTAQEVDVQLTSGTVVQDAWTYNGTAPGPQLRVRQGDLVEVTLVNNLPHDNLRDDGVTIHWHGLDIPNAEDGVAGVTQNAVAPGQRHVYRFRPEQVGTFWYHTHQAPLWAVRRGLFGAIVVDPRTPTGPVTDTTDITLMAHEWRLGDERVAAFGTADTPQHQQVAPGTQVRLRLINTDNNPTSDAEPRQFALVGTPFRVAAIDGTDVNGPTDLTDVQLGLATGGRYDLTFTMPDRPVRLADLGSNQVSLTLSPDTGPDTAGPNTTGPAPAVPSDLQQFDPASYGSPTATPFGPSSHFDRRFTQILDDRLGFFDGTFHFLPTINGRSFPDVPTLMVREGDLVRVLIVNRSHQNHPMHLHGHHALVLTHNREPVTGSPWWVDSLDVRPGDMYEIAFRADNPGIWMDHCHNLDHAANGMLMHLVYDTVYSPFEVGRATPNQPE